MGIMVTSMSSDNYCSFRTLEASARFISVAEIGSCWTYCSTYNDIDVDIDLCT